MIKYKNVLIYIGFGLISIFLNIGCSTISKKLNKTVEFVKPITLEKDGEFLYREKKEPLIKEKGNLILTNKNINDDYINEQNNQTNINYTTALIWSLIMIPISTIIFSFLRKINVI